MSIRGRKPKPAARQIAEGDPRKLGVRKLQEKLAAEPKTTRGLPDPPKHLNAMARAAWLFWADELDVMDQAHRPDAMALEGACVNYARAVAADKILDRDGLTVEQSIIDDESGERIVLNVRKHPAVEISNAAWRQLRAFCDEFGFTPVSRTRLAMEKPDTGESLADLLNAPRPQKQAVQ